MGVKKEQAQPGIDHMLGHKGQQVTQLRLTGQVVAFASFLPCELVANDLLLGVKHGGSNKVTVGSHQTPSLAGTNTARHCFITVFFIF